MIIAVDIDEVLADTLNHFIFLYNQKFKTSFQRDDFYNFNWWEILGLAREEFVEIFTRMVTQGFFSELAVIAGARKGIRSLQEKYQLVIVTGRPKIVAAETRAWLDKHFPKAFTRIYFTREVVMGPILRDKDEICQILGVDLIIEDEFDFAENCAEKNIPVLLFNKPWNRKDQVPSRITRVYSWEDILKEIKNINKNK
jgi:uncharacterized HAD superfamily protein